MSSGLAIMMGTVWLRLAPIQSSIQPFTNAIVGLNLPIRKMLTTLVLWLGIHVFHGRRIRPCFP